MITKLIPKGYKEPSKNMDEFLTKVNNVAKGFFGSTIQSCKEAFMKKVVTLEMYGASLFSAGVKIGKVSIPKAWIVINKQGISIWEPYTMV